MTAMLHRKFSREAIPLMEPYPDKSWEEPGIKKPEGDAVYGAYEETVVGGKEVLHYKVDRKGVNAELYEILRNSMQDLKKQHRKNLERTLRMKQEISTKNKETPSHMAEFASGVKGPPVTSATYENISQQAGIHTNVTEFINKTRNRPTLDKEFLIEQLSVLQKSSTRMSCESEILHEKLKPIFTDEVICLLSEGGRLTREDALAYLKSELLATETEIRNLSCNAKILSAKRVAAEIAGENEGVEETSVLLIPILTEMVRTTHQRMQCVTLAAGEVEEHNSNCLKWKDRMRDDLDQTRDSWKLLKKQVQADIMSLDDYGSTAEKKDERANAIFETKCSRFQALLRENSAHQERVFDDVCKKMEQISLLNEERVELVDLHAKATADESIRKSLHEEWMMKIDLLRDDLCGCVEAENDFQLKSQSVLKGFFNNATEHFMNVDAQQALINTKTAEAKQSLEAFKEFITTVHGLADRYGAKVVWNERAERQTTVSEGRVPIATETQSLRNKQRTLLEVAETHSANFALTSQTLQSLGIYFTDPSKTAMEASARSKEALAEDLARLHGEDGKVLTQL